MHVSRFQSWFFFALLAAIFLLTFQIFQPYLVVLAVSAMAAVVLHPFHESLTTLLRGYRGAAAILTIVVLFVLIIIPLGLIGSQIFQESRDLYQEIRTNKDVYLHVIEDAVLNPLRTFIPQFDLSLDQGFERALGWLIQNFGRIFSSTATIIIEFVLGIVALFYFLRDGKSFLNTFIRLSPLQDRHDRALMTRLESSVNSVLKGQLLIASVQGILAGIGFWIFGIPNPALWGSVAAVCALVPGFGTSLVLVPAIITAFILGEPWQGIGLTIWGALAVGLIDNLLGPTLVGRGANIHPLLVLFGVLGGIAFFGPMGFLLGPMTVSLLLALLDIYQMIVLRTSEIEVER